MADPKEMKFDRRILDRNLRSGAVGKTEYENYMKNLKDVEGNAEVIEFGSLATESEGEPESFPESHPERETESSAVSATVSATVSAANGEGDPTV